MKIKAFAFSMLLLSLLLSNGILWADDKLNSDLAFAAMGADSSQVNALLKQGADPNYKESNRPVLGWAAQSGSVEIVEALINAKADLNAIDAVGHTALMRAVDMDQAKVVEALIKAKADVNVKTTDGKTALFLAVYSNSNPALVKTLIEAGADPNTKTEDGQFPALVAAQNSNEEIITILASGKADLNVSNIIYTPLSYAIEQGDKELVEALLKAGADANAKTKQGRTPLGVANDSGNNEIVELLKKNGAQE